MIRKKESLQTPTLIIKFKSIKNLGFMIRKKGESTNTNFN